VARIPVGTTEGLYVRRAIGALGRPECLPFHFHEMQALQADRGVLDYSSLSVPEARWEDLDPLEFARFRRSIRESEGLGDSSLLNLSDLELAKALGAVEANHEVAAIRVLALLLFGHEAALRRFLPSHEVAFQMLADTRVEVNDFFRWPLLRAMDEILTRFRARNREEELLVGMVRVGVPDYSRRAFREGVANALIHRDYTQLGTVHIQWHRDRIEIHSPGGFPQGIRLDNLLVAGPKPRNPLLADAFKRAGIVERTARGIDTIFYDQLRNGRPAPSYARSTQVTVTLVLPSGKPDLDFVRLVVEESQKGRTFGLDELLVLNALRREGQLSLAHAARLIQKSETDAQMTLLPLTEAGLVVARRQRQEMVYELSAATTRRLGVSPTRKGAREMEDLRELEQKILDYASKRGRITRRETATLCGITDRQSRGLLERLVREGRLVRKGEGRGAFYAPTSKKIGRVRFANGRVQNSRKQSD